MRGRSRTATGSYVTQHYLAARKFANAQPQVVQALLEEVGKIGEWTRDNMSAVAVQLSPLVGLDAATLEVATLRELWRAAR